MHYKVLNYRETEQWIKNLTKFIQLRELLCSLHYTRMDELSSEYKKNYRNKWYGFMYDENFYLGSNGKIYSNPMSWFSLSRMPKLNDIEMDLLWHTNEIEESEEENKMLLERWSKYATIPFELSEKDIVFYQTMLQEHKIAVLLAKKLGIEKHETFNMDENSSSSSRRK